MATTKFLVVTSGENDYWLKLTHNGKTTLTIQIIDTETGQGYAGTCAHASVAMFSAIVSTTTTVKVKDEELKLNLTALPNIICKKEESEAATNLQNQNAYLRWLTRPVKGQLVLSNGWQEYGNGCSTPCYARIGNVVHLSGLVRFAGPCTSNQNVVCTLPEDMRPNRRIVLVAHSYEAIVRVDVLSSGEITFRGTQTAHVSFDGLSFLVQT